MNENQLKNKTMHTSELALSHVNMQFTNAIDALGKQYNRYSIEYYANKLKEADIYSDELLAFVLASNQDPMEWIYALSRMKGKSKIDADEIQALSQKINTNSFGGKKPKNKEWQQRIKELQRRT